MIKGFRFTNQLANAEVDARIHQEFLNKNDGIFYGMGLSYTNNSITVSEGLCEIAGRPIAVIDSETVNVGTENLYCLLILEIDLSKDSTKDVFNQASFKLLTSSTSYPTVTQQDINKYSGTESIYQLEFARFRSGSNGISEFKDTRLFLNFDGIYSQIKSECQSIINQIKQELANVEDGSSYVLKNNIAILKGIQNVTAEENERLDYTFSVSYPSGFSKDNCIVLAFGSRYSNNNKGFSFGTRDSYGSSGAFVETAFGKSVTLLSDKIVAHFYFLYAGASHNKSEYSIEYEIVLMKIPSYEEGVDYTLGDVNGDGKIDNDDMEAVRKYILTAEALTTKQFAAADINKDGEVDAVDMTLLQRMINNQT